MPRHAPPTETEIAEFIERLEDLDAGNLEVRLDGDFRTPIAHIVGRIQSINTAIRALSAINNLLITRARFTEMEAEKRAKILANKD